MDGPPLETREARAHGCPTAAPIPLTGRTRRGVGDGITYSGGLPCCVGVGGVGLVDPSAHPSYTGVLGMDIGEVWPVFEEPPVPWSTKFAGREPPKPPEKIVDCGTRRYLMRGLHGRQTPHVPSLAIRRTASPSSSQGKDDAEFLLGVPASSIRLAETWIAVVLKGWTKRRRQGQDHRFCFDTTGFGNTAWCKVLHSD
ncbi:hypothetical protein GWK47_052477 [Chionoecetes opilio]|uniref:Uncharacterized protein n=1 Tax=Chionoecetes opilio TaxID=41210 RepID=A0A8J5CSQ9_CHIOP|nr:hypothetical protein GWK47_052477 [Chionoecetes opilio]